ncbi:hypothetical protein QYF61_002113 [Mycteria americana]|uniref:Reverse transcriptase domain-containing protein n=1 Tax=Mycteria americana TaxID=33587 RepID=A0AAN7S038_MYCAM|nr:hypothetical protein QYF61_002113 [Mycteria americana]
MLAGLDPLVILYMPHDGTQDDLLHQLSRHRVTTKYCTNLCAIYIIQKVQDFALPLLDLHEIPVSAFIQPIQVPLDGGMTLWRISHSFQFCVISKLAEDPELHHLMVTEAKAHFDLHMPTSPSLLVEERGIDKAVGKEAPALSLWRRLLSAMKERYPFKEDAIYHPGKWTTMEKSIQYLRELAMLEVIYDGGNQTAVYSAGLSEDPSVVGLLRAEEQQVPIATTTSQGVISETRSPFNSPIWPVQKSNGDWRLRIDYSGLNEDMPPLSTAMPDMLELQNELESKAAKWYATIDIANAFFSVSLAAECRPQFAFMWRGVQYTWNRLPQGWKHSPTICHGLIQMVLEQNHRIRESYRLEKTFKIIKSNRKPNTTKNTTTPCP